MSDTNDNRLPFFGITFSFNGINFSYVGEDVNPTLTRGERLAQYSFNDVPIVLMCCVLAFVEYLVH